VAPTPAGGQADRSGDRYGDRLLAAAEREHGGGRLALYRITVVRLPERELVAVAEGQVAIVAG
jgi:acyl-coenzyme A thioesterase PaaI-like protein